MNYVKAKFEDLGWGVADNPYHDLGTDLWLMARDERGWDLGLLVGAQVKSGASYFGAPCHLGSGVLDGWWYAESNRKHFDSWLSHAVPHLIVLFDPSTENAYWVHVTTDAVVSTGQGAKILVPAINMIDSGHRHGLLDVATSQRPASIWEGSAWRGLPDLLPKDRMRHALLASRLVAPHRYRGLVAALSAHEALAMLMQARFTEIDDAAERFGSCPSLADALKSDNWSWRLVGALASRLKHGNIQPLEACMADAPDLSARAAVTAIVAAEWLACGRADDVARLLVDHLAKEDAESVDHAWVQVQLGRAYAEVGRVTDAIELGLAAQLARGVRPDDVTAGAIAAAGASLVFRASGGPIDQLEDLISTADILSNWWRTQTVASALSGSTEGAFKRWAGDNGVVLIGGERAHNELIEVALRANYSGDNDSWRHYESLLARVDLVRMRRTDEPSRYAGLLDALRLAGDAPTLTLASRKIVIDGPWSAAAAAAKSIDLDQLTTTTAKATLALLQNAGDVLRSDIASGVVDWILSTLADDEPFVERTRPEYLVERTLLETLAGVVLAAGRTHCEAVLARLLELQPVTDQLTANAWARVVGALPLEVWDLEAADRAITRAENDHWELGYKLLAEAAQVRPNAQQALIDAIEEGNVVAFGHLGDVRELSDELAAHLVPIAAERVVDVVASAREGRYAVSTVDFAHTLVILNLTHPTVADWGTVLDFLKAPQVRGGDKIASLNALISAHQMVPSSLISQLAAAALALADQQPLRLAIDGKGAEVRAYARNLLWTLDPKRAGGVAEQLSELFAGTDDRMTVIRIVGRLDNTTPLGLLTAAALDDADPRVRAEAAAALARISLSEGGSTGVMRALERAVLDPGTLVPRRVAATLAHASEVPVHLAEVASVLRDHASAQVRDHISHLGSLATGSPAT